MAPARRPIDRDSSSSLVGALVIVAAAAVALVAGISASSNVAPAPVRTRLGTFDRVHLVETCRRLGASERTLAELARANGTLDVAIVAEVAAAERVDVVTELAASSVVPWCAPDVERVDVTAALAARFAGASRDR